MSQLSSLKAFLSHSYKASHINLFFYALLSEVLEIHFDVDESTMATNVTRLERLIRDADVFIGIFPIPEKLGDDPEEEDLQKACRYFKLELDIATRLRKPSIVFIDERYGSLFPIMGTQYVIRYNWQEVLADGAVPSLNAFKHLISGFIQEIENYVVHKRLSSVGIENKDKIGIFVPDINHESTYFTASTAFAIKAAVEEVVKGKKEVEILTPPYHLAERFYKRLGTFDFVILDMNCQSGMSAFLHGLGIPMVRVDSLSSKDNIAMQFLVGKHTVGYPKDIIRASDEADFLSELKERLVAIREKTKQIKLKKTAEAYFTKAVLRKEVVFVSYSGENENEAAPIIDKLKTTFTDVFNYRDKAESIAPGEPWIEEIFDSLSSSSLAVLLLSDSYLKSGNCEHEMQEIVGLHDNKKLKILPVKLFNNKALEIPIILRNIQYIRYWDYDSPDIILDSVVKLLEPKKSSKG